MHCGSEVIAKAQAPKGSAPTGPHKMKFRSLNEVVEKGSVAKNGYLVQLEKFKHDDYWVKFYKEIIYSIEIMLNILEANSINYNEAVTIAGLFQKCYQSHKPPVMSAWYSGIIEFLQKNKNIYMNQPTIPLRA